MPCIKVNTSLAPLEDGQPVQPDPKDSTHHSPPPALLDAQLQRVPRRDVVVRQRQLIAQEAQPLRAQALLVGRDGQGVAPAGP